MTLAAHLLASARKLPVKTPTPQHRGRKSPDAHLYDAARPAIRVALESGMSVTEVTSWVLSTLPKEHRPQPEDLVPHVSAPWNRWYKVVLRESLHRKAAKETNAATP